jgi:hypothetical protein
MRRAAMSEGAIMKVAGWEPRAMVDRFDGTAQRHKKGLPQRPVVR